MSTARPSVATPDDALRATARSTCGVRGHAWSVIGAPLGSTLCRRCGRWEADPLWLPWMDVDTETERNAA